MTHPWRSEPAREDWTSPGGSPCLMRRGCFGVWCGYVGISPGHPWHGRTLWQIPAIVHGYCSWSGPLSGKGPQWWIGFHCGHGFDIAPELVEIDPALVRPGAQYRDLAYVRRETNELAAQAEAAASGSVFIVREAEA